MTGLSATGGAGGALLSSAAISMRVTEDAVLQRLRRDLRRFFIPSGAAEVYASPTPRVKAQRVS